MKNSFIAKITCIAILMLLLAWAPEKNWLQKANDPAFIHRSLKKVTDIIVYDIFSPPVASRTYAYTSIAAYEAARMADTGFHSLAGQTRGLPAMPLPNEGKIYSFSLAAVQALLEVGRSMVISSDSIMVFRKKILQEFRSTGMPADIFERSVEYGNKVAMHVIAWAAKDNYKQTRSMAKYNVNDDSASWKPTPPAYMRAIEPNWNKMRPFLLDSAEQFKPLPAIVFSANPESPFYKEAFEVYKMGIQLTGEQKEIANFWDCNPFKINLSGHVMFATRKISPGGHWINIAAQACRQKKKNYIEAASVYACLSMTLADAFISCWDEKYRSQVIRPETYINQYINIDWLPLLQTPPFPEYPSGHSVVSAAAAEVLSNIFGDEFNYTDATEVEFGLPERKYTSFRQAAGEAAISRLYGGIHYMAAIKNGMLEGKMIGEYAVSKLRMDFTRGDFTQSRKEAKAQRN